MRMSAAVLAACLALAGVSLAPSNARAEIEVDVNRGDIRPLPLAAPDFEGQRGAEIARVVMDNLSRSGLFAPVDSAGRRSEVTVEPDFGVWKSLGAQAMVNGKVQLVDGRLQVDFRLWDVPAGQQLLGLQFTSTPENWRRVAHKISDAVYERLTGEKGYFDTRVVFVSETGSRLERTLRLAVMDQDGANPSYLTDGSEIVLSPRFSASSQEITYMALRPEGSAVYLLNLETGRRESLGQFPGMVFAPRFSPDGRQVAFAVEKNGNSDIWVMNLVNRQSRRLTSDPAIDTSPAFSPDGSRIVFNSDRGGSPQLYIMDAAGGGARRISFGDGRYTSPVWSPTGDFIAFTRQGGGQFHIGVMRPEGSDERTLTSSYMDEGPTWAPNGRVLLFSRQEAGGEPHLWTVDVTGRILKPAPYTGGASDPAWSPLIN
ncbi:MAG: Tol-Pal system beta propeller repeat protein TolB [Phenylobacterium sp.]|uniref:Tol-Pal system beta propeller repeat protein TolB n=1 Tax=Phenylobacterium sp. TaxID=1871053 RepID=UPI00301A68B9